MAALFSKDFVSSIKAEIVDIEQSIKDNPDPRTVKLQELQRLLVLYGESLTQDVPDPPAIRTRRIGIARERQVMLEAVRHILQAETKPLKTSDIYDRLSMMGIDVPGKKPLNNLSAALSYHEDDFSPHGRSGWTLRDAG